MQNETKLFLQQKKEFLGPIIQLDFTAFDSITAHTKLGMEVQPQIHKILTKKIDGLSQAELIKKVRMARACKSAIIVKISSRHLDQTVKSAFIEYLDCLSGWVRGAQLDSFEHLNLNNLIIDNRIVSGEDLAFLLQSEDTGCQTGIIRDSDNSIIMWHTEEDPEAANGDRFDKLRLMSFKYKEKEITAFIYPDLLPGPAFGWTSEGFVQAIDTLFINIHPHQNALITNVVAWSRLCIGSEKNSSELVEAFRPFRTGCAFITIQQTEENIVGNRIEFAGDQWIASSLPNHSGSFLFQVNLMSEKQSEIALTNEEVPPLKRIVLEQRIARTHRALKVIANSHEKVKCLLRLLATRTGGDFAYCNKDVKVHFICQASGMGISKFIGTGPAFVGEKLWMFK
jgi:hypothetical protein